MADSAPPGPNIFLSYAREDEGRARELAGALEQHGFAVFWDREVPPGETWHSHIGQALVNAKCVVVAWSRHSITSDWVIEEASEGKRRRILVPVLFEAVQPPFGFGGIQAASLIDWRPRGRPLPAFNNLLGAIQRIVGGQASSGTGAEAELQAPPQPTPSEPPPKTKPTVRPATPSPARSESRAEPMRPPNGHPSAWSRRMVLATVVGLFAIAGGGGATLFWWLTQPTPISPAPGQSSAPEPTPSEPVDTARAPRPASEANQPGDEMRDCEECPLMVLVPPGEFTMGSPPNEPGRNDDEGPQHKVTIAEPFWVGKYEVTFAQWDACVAAGGCSNKPDDAGWGRENRPVINVNWHDAKEYVGWLSRKTGKTYRLLSEAGWEYAARAGTTTAYWWGDEVGRGKKSANCADCGSEWDNESTAPAGSFAANSYGLHDTAGNVWEWVEDCYVDSYEGALSDGSPWLEGNCFDRVLRGGAWDRMPGAVRSAYRDWGLPVIRRNFSGFRVARTHD